MHVGFLVVGAGVGNRVGAREGSPQQSRRTQSIRLIRRPNQEEAMGAEMGLIVGFFDGLNFGLAEGCHVGAMVGAGFIVR